MVRISRDEARLHLLTHLGLTGRRYRGPRGVRSMLRDLRCIQLDPLDAIGTNADLVALARVDGISKGDVYRHTMPGHAFEHFAKERCILPASAYPHYRDQAVQTPWWRLGTRLERLDAAVIDRVEAEVAARGPITARELTDHGQVRPLDWSGWKGTSKATAMALEVLWTQCRVIVSERTPAGKRFDIPERALPAVHDAPALPFERWALLERVEAAGFLARAGGPCWSMLRDARTTELPDALIAEGFLEEVTIEGSRRPYLAPAGFRDRRRAALDGRMRILAPLDPLLWDRKLVKQIFDFEYIWEVYKPKSVRRWGWYVCPLLHRGRLVGRLEAHVDGDTLVVDRVWPEEHETLPPDALDDALAHHAEALGCAYYSNE
ncbi:MAG: YcaQ family DNA glycosylase [Deltaproteobacteria bacterium]|nr:YcaQ family DNA glycosylase [Deltaproteobacteria bacterium]